MVAQIVQVARLLANVSRRVSRVEKLGLANSATVEFHQVRELAKNKLLSNSETLRALKRLDRSAGTFVKTAERFHGKELRKIARDVARKEFTDVKTRLMAGDTADKFARDQLEKFVKTSRSRLQARVRYLKSQGLDSNDAVTKFQDLISSLNERGGVTSLDVRSLRRVAHNLANMTDYKGLSAKGAREQLAQETRFFGDQARTWSREEKSAVWRAMEREFELNAMRWSSDQVVEMYSEFMKDGHVVEFYQGLDGRIEAELGGSAVEVAQKVNMRKVENNLLQKILGDGDRTIF